ncbi:response regulator [Leptospira sp. 96542]|nr:response regulator [Leptospira sp. 96542]
MFQAQTKVLLLEDDPTISIFYSGILRKNGMDVTSFAGIKVALEYLNANSFLSEDIIITDLQLPDGRALEFVKQVRKINKKVPIFVITSTDDPKTIIEVMKENVQEYIIKPAIPEDILAKIEYHLSKKEVEYQNTIFEKEKIISLEKLLDWYSYKNQRLQNGENETQDLHKNLFHVLRASLSQGAGFGILVQIIDIIKGMEKTPEGNYILQKEILDILEENSNYSKKILDMFTEIEDVIFDRVPIEITTPKQILQDLSTIKKDMSELLLLKNQSFVMGEFDPKHLESHSIQWNGKYFHKVFYELLLNAMRFSKASSKIYSMFLSSKEGFRISIINSLGDGDQLQDGIPNEYADLIFEPFFRLNKNIYEKYGSLDFGIGLSFVRETIQKFGGTISVFNILDHTVGNKDPKIEFRIFLPYHSSEK